MDNELTNYLDFSPFYAGFEFEDESSRRTFFDEYVKLPLVLKNFMVSPEVSTQLFNFGKIKDLNDVQTTVMSSILKYVLSGHIYLKDVPGLLVHYINVDRVKAEDILASLAKQVLPPVWPDLKKIQILNFGVGRSQELDQLLQLSATSTISPSQSPISATPKPLVPPAPSSPPKIPGADLPETGGNIIDLRKQPQPYYAKASKGTSSLMKMLALRSSARSEEVRFQVPQFIETETKIIGPFTLKQFLWLAGGVVLMFLFNFLVPPRVFIAVAILIGAAAITFAYLKIEGLSLATYLLRALAFSLSSKKYMFTKHDEIQTFSLTEKRSGDEYKF